MAARVDARGWGWRHPGRRAWAVRHCDLSVEPGERVLLLGASGSGKSTLLRALAGLLGEGEGEQEGELEVDRRRPRPGRAGLVLQNPDAQVILSRVGDDVAFGCENLGVPPDEIWDRVRRALAVVGLHHPLDHPTAALSGGEKQRLALAGVLAMRPGLLLLDEPTANLDPAGVIEVTRAVAAATDDAQATLVVVEHRVSTWLPHVDRVVALSPDGGVLADGPPGQVLVERRVELADAGVWLPDGQPAPPRPAGPAPQPAPLLVTSGLAVGRGRDAVWSGPDLTLDGGRFTALAGANGAGKSTLALTLAGLLPPVGGSVAALAPLARGLTPDPHRWRSRQRVSRLGFVFQNPEHQLVAPTVEAELAVGLRVLGHADGDVRRDVDEMLHRLRLDRLGRANPFTLSGGEQRRLSVASALITAPSLLVLDEPTFGQDARTWRELVGLLLEAVRDGAAVLVASHDPELLSLADRVLHLRTEVAV